MTEFEKMLAGKDFDAGSDCIERIRQHALNLLLTINQNTDDSQRNELFQQLMGTISHQVLSAHHFIVSLVKRSRLEKILTST